MKKMEELRVTDELIEKIDNILKNGTTHRLTIILLIIDDEDVKNILYLYIKMNEVSQICEKTGFDEDFVKNAIRYVDECNRMIDSRSARRFRENRKQRRLQEQKHNKKIEIDER